MNTFGSASRQFPLYCPVKTREARKRFRREAIELLARANSFYCPAGRWPSRGWFLLARSDYDQIDKYSTSLQLNIGDPTKPDNIGTIKNLSIVQAQCVTRGLSSDRNALYLVEVTDGRGLVYNKWFKFPLTTSYNIRAPAYPQTFYTGTLNSGTTWTWSTMCQNIWNQMIAFLGSFPGLPITPSGTPEGFWFPGVSAWSALNGVLDQLGLTIVCNPTSATPYTIVQPGASDSSFTTLQSRYTTHLEDDLEWIDTGAGRVPKTIVVLFRRRNSVYGTEEVARYDSFQWATTPFYSVSVNAPSTFSSAVGTHYLWTDFTVRYDNDGNPLSADTATANTIAQEQVTDYFAKVYHQTLGSMTQVYAGALPFVTGSRVDGVCWYQDFRDSDHDGWRTQIVRGFSPPWSNIYEDDAATITASLARFAR